MTFSPLLLRAPESRSTAATAARPSTAAAAARPLRRRMLVVSTVLLGLVASSMAMTASAEAKAPGHERTAKERHIQTAVLHEINAERHAHGLSSVHMNKQLKKAARRHDYAMSRANTMSHRVSGEASFTSRFDHAGYHWMWAGENIGWNHTMTTSGVLRLQRIMYNEQAPNDGHRQNILNKHFRNVGVDVFLDKKHHKVWLTTDFGRR